MKYDCSDEFDLNEIYRKLTAPSQPQTVKANEFFAPRFDLALFQKHMAELVGLNNSHAK